MKTKILLPLTIFSFLFIFFTLYVGLNRSNIYIPDTVTNEKIPTLKISHKKLNSDITIVAWGGILPLVEEAVEKIFINEEIVCNIIVPQSIYPLNIYPVIENLLISKKLIIIEDDTSFIKTKPPSNPVAVPLFAKVAPEGILIVSPDCPIVIVPVPAFFNIVSTFNVLIYNPINLCAEKYE